MCPHVLLVSVVEIKYLRLLWPSSCFASPDRVQCTWIIPWIDVTGNDGDEAISKYGSVCALHIWAISTPNISAKRHPNLRDFVAQYLGNAVTRIWSISSHSEVTSLPNIPSRSMIPVSLSYLNLTFPIRKWLVDEFHIFYSHSPIPMGEWL